jgi:hypothetical protein
MCDIDQPQCDQVIALMIYELENTDCLAASIALSFANLGTELTMGRKLAHNTPNKAAVPPVPVIANRATRREIQRVVAVEYAKVVTHGDTATVQQLLRILGL